MQNTEHRRDYRFIIRNSIFEIRNSWFRDHQTIKSQITNYQVVGEGSCCAVRCIACEF